MTEQYALYRFREDAIRPNGPPAQRVALEHLQSPDLYPAVTIYMGGYYAFNHKDINNTLLRQVRSYIGYSTDADLDHTLLILTEEHPKGDEPTLDHVRAFNEAFKDRPELSQVFFRNAYISDADSHFIETVLLPDDVLLAGDPDDPEHVGHVARYVTRFNFLGYSTGASVIQRFQNAAILRLSEAGYQDDDIAHICNSVVTQCLGPVSYPVTTGLGFCQLHHFSANDRVIKNTASYASDLGTLNIPIDHDAGVGISWTAQETDIILRSDIGDNRAKALRLRPDPESGEDTLQVIDSADPEWHLLFLYTNPHGYCPEREMQFYPSFPAVDISQSFFRGAIEASLEAAETGRRRDGKALITDFAQTHLCPGQLQIEAMRYENAAGEFDTLSQPENQHRARKMLERARGEGTPLVAANQSSPDETPEQPIVLAS